MSGFHLREQIGLWFRTLEVATSQPLTIILFSIVGALMTLMLARGIVWASPHAGPRIMRWLDEMIEWQVERMFKWAKWHSQTKDSLWWAVLCAMSISAPVLITLRFPILLPLALIIMPCSLTTF